jgi:hypothetical protein
MANPTSEVAVFKVPQDYEGGLCPVCKGLHSAGAAISWDYKRDSAVYWFVCENGKILQESEKAN